MKKLSLSLITLILISACSSSDDEVLSVAREGSPPNQVVEYVWHYKDTNFSEENLNMLIDKWNSMIDSRDYEMNGANILFPRGESAADFIWVMLWPSMEARDAAWDDWMNNLDEDWQNLINGIMKVDFDNVYAFKPTVQRTASVPNQSSYFENEFNFCNFNEGANADTLHNYRADLNAITDFSDNHWYTLLEPKFVPEESFDVIWLDIWASEEDKASDTAKWKATEFPQRAADMLTCGDNGITGIDFSGIKVRD